MLGVFSEAAEISGTNHHMLRQSIQNSSNLDSPVECNEAAGMMNSQREKIVIGQMFRVQHLAVVEFCGIAQTNVIRPEIMIGSQGGSAQTTRNIIDAQPARVRWLRHNPDARILRDRTGSLPVAAIS